ncbi:MAG: glutamate-5-semialdehyde dehydrogenase [Chloroflexi bacterium]|jgi:glutamate-5-semialdehyde dehydrogenase|nr:MAG: glutamate-5-semialdehyde dehydrogenase [Chloroflexota bacterium]
MNSRKLSEQINTLGHEARVASRLLAKSSTEAKNQALLNISEALLSKRDMILESNRLDYEAALEKDPNPVNADRLMLNAERLADMADGVRKIVSLNDPIGEEFDETTLENGLSLKKRRVPLGIIGVIYESRPNVTVEIASLCLKTGNATILRGGSEALNSNKALVVCIKDAIRDAGLPSESVQFIESTDRVAVNHMLNMREYIDLLIPRGSESLVRLVAEKATMPAITGGVGVSHTYIDSDADLEKALAIAFNAKVQRPSVCNALDTLLVHSAVASEYLPRLAEMWIQSGVTLHIDERAMNVLGSLQGPSIVAAKDEDWGREYLSLDAAVKVVDSLDDAMFHIETYGSAHSEAIVTESDKAANRFLDEIDAAVVFVNASTRFTDGGEFGFGAEVAISTDKIHARGPMGLKEITSYKWTVVGTGQVRL